MIQAAKGCCTLSDDRIHQKTQTLQVNCRGLKETLCRLVVALNAWFGLMRNVHKIKATWGKMLTSRSSERILEDALLSLKQMLLFNVTWSECDSNATTDQQFALQPSSRCGWWHHLPAAGSAIASGWKWLRCEIYPLHSTPSSYNWGRSWNLNVCQAQRCLYSQHCVLDQHCDQCHDITSIQVRLIYNFSPVRLHH